MRTRPPAISSSRKGAFLGVSRTATLPVGLADQSGQAFAYVCNNNDCVNSSQEVVHSRSCRCE